MTCPLCGGALNARPTIRLRDSAIHRCEQCGSGIAWPRPAQTQLNAAHDNPLYFNHPYFETHRSSAASPLYEARLALVRPALSGPSRTLVDVGCDTGAFMGLVAERLAVRAIGVDVSSQAVAAAQRAGRDVRVGTLEAQRLDAGSVDVVTAFDVVEHVAEPGELLSEARRVLKPGGLFVAEVPHYDGLIYRLGRALGRLRMLAGPMSGIRDRLWPAFHVQYPTQEGIRAALQRAGLRDVVIGGREFAASELAIERGWLRTLVIGIFGMARAVSSPTILVVTARSHEAGA